MAEGENKMYKVNTVYLLGLAPFSLLSDIEKLLALIKHRVYKRFFLCNWQEIYREMELKRNLSALRNVNRPK